MKPIEEISGSRADKFPEEILAQDVPVVLKGFVADWPVVSAAKEGFDRLSEYIQSFYCGEPLLTFYGEPNIQGRVFYTDDLKGFNFKTANVKLDEVLKRIATYRERQEQPVFYVGSTKVDRWFPGFRKDNDIHWLQRFNPLVSVWMGNRSVISSHYDFPSNIACNVAGRRRFTLFPPEQIKNLYVGPLDKTPAGRAVSMVDVRNPDLERYPNFLKALEEAFVADLELGDALYLPSMWWHHVEGLDDFNILVNYWWRSSPAYLGNPEDSFYHALLNIRSLPKAQRNAWREIFEFYIFNEDDSALNYLPEEALGVLGEIDEAKANMLRSQLLNKLSR